MTYDEVEEESGVGQAALKAWRHKNKPGLDSIEAVLGFLGWDFLPIPRAKVLPKDVVEDVAAVAARRGESVEKKIEVLVGLAARIHERFPFTEPPRGRGSEPTPTAAALMLTRQEAATVIGVSAETLNRWEQSGKGPVMLRLSPWRVLYPATALRDWIAEETPLTVPSLDDVPAT